MFLSALIQQKRQGFKNLHVLCKLKHCVLTPGSFSHRCVLFSGELVNMIIFPLISQLYTSICGPLRRFLRILDLTSVYCKCLRSQRSPHLVPRPRLELLVNWKHPTSVTCSQQTPVSFTRMFPWWCKWHAWMTDSCQECSSRAWGQGQPWPRWFRALLQLQLGLAQIWSRGRLVGWGIGPSPGFTDGH